MQIETLKIQFGSLFILENHFVQLCFVNKLPATHSPFHNKKLPLPKETNYDK